MTITAVGIPDHTPRVRRATYCQARCGAGKTTSALRTMASTPNRYVYVVDRKAVIEERTEFIAARAAEAGTKPFIEVVTSGGENKGGQKPIPDLIAEAVRRCERLDHAIIIVTHKGLTMSHRQTYGTCSWNLIVDEVPDIHEVKSIDLGPFLTPFLASLYRLDDDGTIGLIRPVPAREFDRPHMAPFRGIHDLIRSGQARASITSWDQAARPWYIERTWDVSVLDAFSDIHFTADSFRDSVTYKVLEHEGVQWEEVFLSDHRVWRARSVTVNYYTDRVAASGHQWRKAEIKEELKKVAAHMTSMGVHNHLWTVSAEIDGVFDVEKIGGARVSPKQAGSNQWREWHDATMLYSAKPSPDEVLVHARRGMTADDITRAREGVDIRQFVMRLSLRDPDSTAPVTVRLFDRRQADDLAAYLRRAYGFEVVVAPIDVGITKPARKAPRTILMTDEERKASRQLTQRRNYLRRKAKGMADETASENI